MTNRDDLIGFLCGALEDAERERIEQALESSEELRAELRALEAELDRLEPLREVDPPPDDLWERTCDLIAEHSATQAQARPTEPSFAPTPARREAIPAHTSRWSMYDAVVLTGVLSALAMLFFPALANSRHAAQIADCQNNLRQLGLALVNYSVHHDGFFVPVPVDSQRGAAGIVGPILFEGGYIEDPRVLLCPASPQADDPAWRLPSLSELDRANGRRLRILQRSMGGSYGYNLGVRVDGRCRPPRNRGRDYFALLADAPSLHLADRRSANHYGRGHNLLFEDGNIRFVNNLHALDTIDNPFLSYRGYVEPGIDFEDAVLAESAVTTDPTP